MLKKKIKEEKYIFYEMYWPTDECSVTLYRSHAI